MIQIPEEYLFGVDVAMQKLRPGASFELSGTVFSKWHDPAGTNPPAWSEVMEQIEKDKARYDEYIAKLEAEEATKQ